MMRVFIAIVALACLCGSVAAVRWHQVTDDYSFEQYVVDHNKPYTPHSPQWTSRRALFETAKADVMLHNANPAATYKKTVNKFSDMTAEELRAYRGGFNSAFVGYKPTSQQPFTLPLQPVSALPKAVDWRTKGVVTGVKDQAQCGSCWAFATTETIESHVALSSEFYQAPVLSPQQIVSCVPNTKHCGGTGGCQGGIPEIAYDYLKGMGGMTEEFFYGYTSAWGDSGTCQFTNKHSAGGTPAVATVDGFVKLPVNNYTAVMNALASVGPLAINVAAGAWHAYDSGVYTGCNSTTTDIDHVVQLVGYGTDSKQGDYWIVRNSWNPTWGEGGYIRLARNDGKTCGTDTSPKDGTGCDGGPAEVTVCGPCALTYDVSYPTGARFL